MSKEVASALRDTLVSPNVSDANFEPANVVDALDKLSRSVAFGLKYLGTGDASTTMGAIEFHATAVKEAGESIARAIDGLSEAIREAIESVSAR